MPHPKTDFNKNQLHPDEESHGSSTQKCHFSKQNWHSDDVRLRNLVIQKPYKRKYVTSIVEHVRDERLCKICAHPAPKKNVLYNADLKAPTRQF